MSSCSSIIGWRDCLFSIVLLLFLCARSLNSTYMWSGLPWWLSGKVSTCNAGGAGSTPGSARCPGGGHGNPLQYSCLENPVDRGAWWAAVHKVAKNLKWPSAHMWSTSGLCISLHGSILLPVLYCLDNCEWLSDSHSVMPDSLQPCGLLSARILCPWNSPGKEYWGGLLFPSYNCALWQILKSGHSCSPIFPSSVLCWLFWIFCRSTYTLVSTCQYPWNNFL